MLTSLGQTAPDVVSVSSVLRKSRKPVVRDVVVPRMRPSAMVMSAGAVSLGAMIIFNAFFGNGGTGGVSRFTAAIPQGASTRATVAVSGKTSRTVTLRYDETVEDVQRELMSLGHFHGLVDGVVGPQTRVAIEAYQRENQMSVTGEVSTELLDHIRYTRKISQAAEFTGSLSPAPAVAPVEEAAVEPVVDEAPVAAAPEYTDGDKTIAMLQERLAALGYDPGSQSGQLDEGTRSAILIFEMDNGLAMDGKISKALLSALKQAEGQKSASR